jgi:hypothetical protein
MDTKLDDHGFPGAVGVLVTEHTDDCRVSRVLKSAPQDADAALQGVLVEGGTVWLRYPDAVVRAGISAGDRRRMLSGITGMYTLPSCPLDGRRMIRSGWRLLAAYDQMAGIVLAIW